MAEGNKRSDYALATTDIFSLKDSELKAHINDLQSQRNELKGSVVPSVGECNTLIALAHAELSSRATDRLARKAIWLSATAIFVSCALTLVPILTK